jgi:hypothetical protein
MGGGREVVCRRVVHEWPLCFRAPPQALTIVRCVRVFGLCAGSSMLWLIDRQSSYDRLVLGEKLPYWMHQIRACCAVVCWAGWGLHFLLGVGRATGIFVIMLLQMLVQDMVRFVALFVVLLCAFVHAFYLLELSEDIFELSRQSVQDQANSSIADVDFVGLLKMKTLSMFYVGFIGEPSDEETAGERSHLVYTVISMFYILIVPVMLLNLLVAMLADTYTRVYSDVQLQYELERAALMCDLEHSLSPQQRRHWRRRFCTAYGGQDWTVVALTDQSFYSRNDFDQSMETVSLFDSSSSSSVESRAASDGAVASPAATGGEMVGHHYPTPEAATIRAALGFGRLDSPHHLRSHAAELEAMMTEEEQRIGAAALIQATYRGYKVFKQYRRLHDTTRWVQAQWRGFLLPKGRLRHRGERKVLAQTSSWSRAVQEGRIQARDVVRARLPSVLPTEYSGQTAAMEDEDVSGGTTLRKHMTLLKMMARQLMELEKVQQHTLACLQSNGEMPVMVMDNERTSQAPMGRGAVSGPAALPTRATTSTSTGPSRRHRTMARQHLQRFGAIGAMISSRRATISSRRATGDA